MADLIPRRIKKGVKYEGCQRVNMLIGGEANDDIWGKSGSRNSDGQALGQEIEVLLGVIWKCSQNVEEGDGVSDTGDTDELRCVDSQGGTRGSVCACQAQEPRLEEHYYLFRLPGRDFGTSRGGGRAVIILTGNGLVCVDFAG